MVSSLQSIVLFSVPIAMLFDMLKLLCHLPMGHECLRAMFRHCTHEELRAWAKTLPWDHPVARKLDHEVHRRRMAGEFYGFSFFFRVWVPFFDFYRGIQGVRVFTIRVVACPPVSLPSTCQTQLGRAVLGSSLFVLIFIFSLDSWEYVENQPVCHIYQWVAHPTPGGVCNHCERMMDGLRLDDLIAGNREGSLTEDEIVQYVQDGDPNQRDWDDFPLRMTFRINSFLRQQGDVGEPDLAALGFLEED